MRLIQLVKGWPGKPSHPPLTDATIGAYTIGVAMLVFGAFGVQEEQMAHGALLAIGGGVALALPTASAGLIDWLDIPKGTPARTTATLHLYTMLTATLVFALTFVAQLDGYQHGDVKTLALIAGVVAEALLVAGGYLGGTIVFVYGERVLKRPETPFREAVIPGRVESPRPRESPTPPRPDRRDAPGQAH